MNQNPEQIARDKIDTMLDASGGLCKAKDKINLNAGVGIAVTEYQTEVGPRIIYYSLIKNPSVLLKQRE